MSAVTWTETDRQVARIVNEMIGAADYFDAHPEHATDERLAEVWREYVTRLRAVERPA